MASRLYLDLQLAVCVRLALSVAHFEVLVSMPEREREGERVHGGVSAKKNSHT